MSEIPSLIEAMRAAGCSPEQILAAVEHQAKIDALEAESRREKARLKKRKQRALSLPVPVCPGLSLPVPGTTGDLSLPLMVSPPPLYNKTNTPPSLNPLSHNRAFALDFLTFWEIYPLKKGKGAAEKSWAKATKIALGSEILEAVRVYRWPEDPQFTPLPATWLNQRRWEDEQPAEAPKPVRKERDLRNVPDSLLSNDDYWKKRTQLREWK